MVTFDLGCATQIFGARSVREPQRPRYQVAVCGVRRRAVTADGLSVRCDCGLDGLGEADTVVVPGYDGAHLGPPPPAAVRALRAAAERARVISICVGAFALAHAGLLYGRRATTHWAATRDLADQFPDVEVVAEPLYIDEGRVMTSAGLAAGIDLVLHVVRADHGAWAAAEIARWNLVAPHRDGGQAQFIPRPVHGSDGTGLAETMAWALARLERPLTSADLAAHAHCSQRTLTRRFRAEVGSSPKRWLLDMRMQRARELLESSALSVDEISDQSGFPTPAALRARFKSALGTTPSAYRKTFRTPP